MTETETNSSPQAAPPELLGLIQQWHGSQPVSVSEALVSNGYTIEQLETAVRSELPADGLRMLREVLIRGAAGQSRDDQKLWNRMLPAFSPVGRALDRLVRARESKEVLTARVTEVTPGGVEVDLGVRGFVPRSQIGLNPPRDLQHLLGRTMRLQVIEVDPRKQTAVLSNRAVLERERDERRQSVFGQLTEGEDREGTVQRLTEIGAFVDVGGIDGLLHVSEISWKRIGRPADVLRVGQKVRVRLIRVDMDSGKVGLSMRRLLPDPWEEARRKYAMGASALVRITETVPQGAVVGLEEDGLEGFIPVSELAGRRIASPEEVVQQGQEVEAVVIDLRPRERKIIFSLRKLEQQKQRHEIDKYQKSTRSTSERTTLGDLFGHLFPELSGGTSSDPEPGPPAAEATPPADTTPPADATAPADEAPAADATPTEGVAADSAVEALDSPVEAPAEAPPTGPGDDETIH